MSTKVQASVYNQIFSKKSVRRNKPATFFFLFPFSLTNFSAEIPPSVLNQPSEQTNNQKKSNYIGNLLSAILLCCFHSFYEAFKVMLKENYSKEKGMTIEEH